MIPLTHKIKIDLVQPDPMPLVNAVQGDSNSREIVISLFYNSKEYTGLGVLNGALGYKKPDGTRGLYDKLPNGDDAVKLNVQSNTAAVILAPQVLTCPGLVRAALVLRDKTDLSQISTFPFLIDVAPNPAAGQVVSNDYYKYSTMADINEALAKLEKNFAGVSQYLDRFSDDIENMGTSLNAVAADLIAVDGSSAIVAEATGSSIALTDASDRPLRGLILYGKTTQSGTPAPDAPVELVNVGSTGTTQVTVQGQTVTVPTPNGLPGLPVASGGNYTDESGRQWICDTMNLIRGVYVKRIAEKVLTGTSEAWFGNAASYANWVAAQCAKDATASTPVMCTHYVGVAGGSPSAGQVSISNAGSVVIKDPAIGADSAAIKTYLAEQYAAGTPVRVRYALAAPVETPLDAQSLATYAALHTVKLNTTVLNDTGAGMKVAYVADAKAYIDNKFAALSAAIMNA